MFFVRTAGKADLPRVSVLLGRSRHAIHDARKAAAGHSVAALDAWLSRPDSEFVVADDGSRIGGMAYAAMDRGEADVAVLHALHVDPDLMRQGIGRDLFAEVEACFPSAKRMRLSVDPENERAVRFFIGLGFREAGRLRKPAADQSGIAAILMEKTLSFPG